MKNGPAVNARVTQLERACEQVLLDAIEFDEGTAAACRLCGARAARPAQLRHDRWCAIGQVAGVVALPQERR